MKVLWFSNTPAAALEKIQAAFGLRSSGGWLYVLNKAMEQKVDLHVAFHHPYRLAPFTHGKSWFHPIYTGNILIQRLRERIGLLPFYGDMTQRYLDIIHEVNPDIIHIHGTESPFLTILERTRIPSVVSLQGNLTVCAHKYCAGFHGRHLRLPGGRLSLRSLVIGRPTYLKGLRKLKRSSVIERQHLSKAQQIIGRTDWDRRITRILAPKSQYCIGHEMLRDRFYSEKWKQPCALDTGKRVVFTTTSNGYFKGFETICYALSLLNALDINVEWRVAGVSEDSLIAKVTRRELGADYPDRGLMLMGALDEHELISKMQEASLYVMPSHIENSANSLCEAMMIGMPCVATFAGGTGSILSDGKEGILVQDGDPWAMAGAMLELFRDQEKAARYGAAARRHAHARHNRGEILADLIGIYERVIAKAQRPFSP